MKFLSKYQDQFYFLFRVITGLLFFLHGASKFGIIGSGNIAGFATAMSLPVWIAYLVAGAELLGGAGIMVGFFTRLSALVELLLWLVRLYWHIFLRVFQV